MLVSKKDTFIDIGSTSQTDRNLDDIIDTFNNKGQKGDDDFETWLVNEAPFVPEEDNKYTITVGDTTYDTSFSNSMSSTLTGLSPTFTVKNDPHFARTKQKKLPIDILHKWYPTEMKDQDDDISF